MLAITLTEQPSKQTPNLLPCALKHDGPIPISPRHWNPIREPTKAARTATITTSDQQQLAQPPQSQQRVSYFRGRRLLAHTLHLPAHYEGAILQSTSDLLPAKRKQPAAPAGYGDDEDDAIDEEADAEVEVKVLQKKARFDKVVIWGHEGVPESDDVYVKGVGEWIGFAEAMHCDDENEDENGDVGKEA